MSKVQLSSLSLFEEQGSKSLESEGYLSTSGSAIVSSDTGEPISLIGSNWFGAESELLIPHGLWARNYMEMMDEMVDSGLNLIRMPISPAIITDAIVTTGFRADLNPELVGKTPLEITDLVIDYAGQIGLQVVIDMHRITPGVGKQEDGLWFNEDYSIEDLASDWKVIAERYAGNDTVVGVDLFNEPSGEARWGDEAADPSLDWAAAATYLGNSIHEVNPDLLIIVEGVHIVDNKWYWVGGNLKGVADQPISLDQPNKLVYSPHDYPSSVVDVPWLQGASPEDMVDGFREHWGFIVENGIAPILVGETGARMNDPRDAVYLDALFGYLSELSEQTPGGANVTWWGWNPNSGDTGGLLSDDWRTLHDDKMSYLDQLTDFERPENDSFITFEMDHNTHVDRMFTYSIESGTAIEGEDFFARDGVLHFDVGQTEAKIGIDIFTDGVFEDDETVVVDLFWTDGRFAGSYEVIIQDAEHAYQPDSLNVAFDPPMNVSQVADALLNPEDTGHGIFWYMPDVGFGQSSTSELQMINQGDLKIEFEIKQTWGAHFFAKVLVTNTSDQELTDWDMQIMAQNFELLEVHSAGHEFHDSGTVQIDAPDWNSVLSVGETSQFGIDGQFFDLG